MKKLAIIGTGMAGMSAAYFLRDDFDITIFEKNDYIGGHTNTVYIDEESVPKPIETGFIVFNEVTYPNMVKLFKELNVPYHDSDMSFSVLEFLDIQKLCKLAPKIVEDPRYDALTVKDLVDKEGYGQNFLDHFIFININGERFVDKSKVLKRIVYHHPLFDRNAVKAQERLPELNKGFPLVYFCGSYFRYGFHENALLSSVNLCEEILGRKVL